MARAVLRVIAAGPHCSIQDGGRKGLMRFGVPASGGMDRAALALANAALGVDLGSPVIEISLGGLVLDVEQGSITLAVTGGGFHVDAAGRTVGSWSVLTLHEGDRLQIKRGHWGSWCYLAFAGTLQTQTWLGSAATHALSGFGGGMVRPGDRYVVDKAFVLPERALPCPVWARPRSEVAVVIGPQERFFDQDRLDMLLGATFRLTDAYDRMGVRLRGPSLAPQGALSIPSEPVLRGSVQVAGDGVATVLMADHQTTGGYPKIATLVGSETDAFAQLRPHAPIAFRAVTPEQALGLVRIRTVALTRVVEKIRNLRNGSEPS